MDTKCPAKKGTYLGYAYCTVLNLDIFIPWSRFSLLAELPASPSLPVYHCMFYKQSIPCPRSQNTTRLSRVSVNDAVHFFCVLFEHASR